MTCRQSSVEQSTSGESMKRAQESILTNCAVVDPVFTPGLGALIIMGVCARVDCSRSTRHILQMKLAWQVIND